MIVMPCAHGLEHLVGVSPGGRSMGKLHMSDLYGRYHEAISGKKYDENSDPTLYFEAGLAWEQILEKGLKERLTVSRPGELVTTEGIVYSPDLIIYEAEQIRLGEIKLTWMSSKGMPQEKCTDCIPERFGKYMTQIMSYAYHLETPYARLITFFVNGNYKPMKPQLFAWDLTFTKRELAENWKKMVRFATKEGMLP